MSRQVGAGVLEIAFHPSGSFANDQAPTVAELNGTAVFLTSFLTDGGLSDPLDGTPADSADMGSKFDKMEPGTFGGQPLTAEMFRDDTTDTAWDTLLQTADGYLSIVRFGLATPGTFAAADEIELWRTKGSSRSPVDVARGDMQRFQWAAALPAEPLQDFVLV